MDYPVLPTPIRYISEEGGFTLGIGTGDARPAHMARDPSVTIVAVERDFPYRGNEVRSRAQVTDRPYGPAVRRIAARCVGEEAAPSYDDEAAEVIVRIEPADARGLDFRDDLEAMGLR
jgi:hypothetical protein